MLSCEAAIPAPYLHAVSQLSGKEQVQPQVLPDGGNNSKLFSFLILKPSLIYKLHREMKLRFFLKRNVVQFSLSANHKLLEHYVYIVVR